MSDLDDTRPTDRTLESERAERALRDEFEGRYRVTRKLGEGGMATVYLAHDLKNDRPVALKLLKPELGAVIGADRFLSEIRTTANLQHPHILPLFDSGEVGQQLFYVMPYVEGESLRERLDREGQLPVDEAVQIATNVAEALDYAHRKGVIHRDIKPANVLLLDGKPVVADFGIALAVGEAGGGRLTETGLSLGTPRYMSPEQATGDLQVGPRSDIYSLGCVLYEMLAGEPPVTGRTAQAILGKIIAGKTTSVIEHRPAVPPHVNGVVTTAIQRLAADRFASAADFRAALHNPAYRAESTVVRASGVERRVGLVSLVAALGTLVAGVVLGRATGTSAEDTVLRYDQELLPGRSAAGLPNNVDISPDGEATVRVWWPSAPLQGQVGGAVLQLKHRSDIDFVTLPGTEDVLRPRFSPAGNRIAFTSFTSGELSIVSLDGAVKTVLADSVSEVEWLTEGELILAPWGGRSIERLSTDGSGRALVYEAPDSATVRLMGALPGGAGLLFSLDRRSEVEIWGFDMDRNEARFLHSAIQAQYMDRTGHLLLGTADGRLLAAPFVPERLSLRGDPVVAMDGLASMPFGVGFRASMSGTLMTALGAQVPLIDQAENTHHAIWIDSSGVASPVETNWAFRYSIGLTLAPGGTRLALAIPSDDDTFDIWVKDLPDGPAVRVADGLPWNHSLTFTPDGEELAFIRPAGPGQDSELFTVRADGASPPEPFPVVVENPVEISYSVDGQWLLVGTREQGGDRSLPELRVFRLEPEPVRIEVPGIPLHGMNFRLSPDGRWLAYYAGEDGEEAVYVRPFPDLTSGRVRISSRDVAFQPVWHPGADELLYQERCYEDCTGDWQITTASFTDDDGFTVTRRTPLKLPRLSSNVMAAGNGPLTTYAVSPEDGALLDVAFIDEVLGSTRDRLVVIENWDVELLRLLDESR